MSDFENEKNKPSLNSVELQAVRQHLERFRLLVENSRDVVAEVSVSGHILYVSPNSKKVMGYASEELLHTSVFERVHPDDLPHVREQFVLPEGAATCRHRHRDGSWRWFETTGRIFLAPNGQTRVVLIIRDISERKQVEGERMQLEARLRQIHKMEALGALAGGIAHDFNNLLTVIIGCTELAIMDAQYPQETVKHLTQVKKASGRAKELVQQILAFSRKQKQERKPMRLQTVITESLELMRHTLPATIEIAAHVDPNTPVVMADATQIYQVMINLCTNAAHAMEKRPGRLSVSLMVSEADDMQALAIPGLQPGRHVKVAINDTGHGMDAETLGHIFEPFFTTKEAGEGTGLGLSVVQGIVREHQGAITVESQPGVGTTLNIFLPVLECASLEHEGRSKSLPRGSGERILLVDDEPAVCGSHQVLLTRLGYRVTAMTDPVEALKMFREHADEFDLLISDMTMPHMTGIDLIRQVVEFRPTLPAILASGSPGMASDHVQKFGVSDLLYKPASLFDLANVVHRAIGSKRAG